MINKRLKNPETEGQASCLLPSSFFSFLVAPGMSSHSQVTGGERRQSITCVAWPGAALNGAHRTRDAGETWLLGNVFMWTLFYFIDAGRHTSFSQLKKIALSRYSWHTIKYIFQVSSKFWWMYRWWNHHHNQESKHLHHQQKQNTFMTLFFPFSTSALHTFSACHLREGSDPGQLQVTLSP